VPGTEACPWTLAALPGQRVRLRVIVIDPRNDPLALDESLDVGGRTDTCPQTLVIQDSIESLVIQDSVLESTVHLPVCNRDILSYFD